MPVGGNTTDGREVANYVDEAANGGTADASVQYTQPTVGNGEVEVVRRFIREVGLPDGILTGVWSELRSLVRSSFSYDRF